MMWELKTYKMRKGDYASVCEKELRINPMAMNAVKQRIDYIYTSGQMEDKFDLSLNRDRQLIGYNYLIWKKEAA